MSVVVIGGHERMIKQYKNVGKKYGCKVKVFTYNVPQLDKNIGNPDYLIMFTDVVSHKLVNTALKISRKRNVPTIRLHNSSLNSINDALEKITKTGKDFCRN